MFSIVCVEQLSNTVFPVVMLCVMLIKLVIETPEIFYLYEMKDQIITINRSY